MGRFVRKTRCRIARGHGNGQLPVRSAKLQLRLTVSWTPPEAAFDDLGAAETAN
jgi:hypothetical protein